MLRVVPHFRALPSTVRHYQSGPMTRLRRILLTVLFLSATYLFAWPTATIQYEVTVLLHLGAGILFAIFCAPYILRKIFVDGRAEERVGWHLIGLGLILGIILIFTGTTRNYAPMLYAHIFICTAGGVVLAASWLRRQEWFRPGYERATYRPANAPAPSLGWPSKLTKTRPVAIPVTISVVAYLIIAALAVGVSYSAWWLRTEPWARNNRIVNPSIAPASMDSEGDGPSGPFFPSSAQTEKERKIAASYFLESDTCERCHADIYKQWNSSAHHFSSFNNQWYRKSVEYMQDVRGIKPSKWCAGCHDPALLFSGEFDRPVREVEHTPEGQAGLGCMMCHSVAHVKSTMGQADFNLETPALHDLAVSKNPVARSLHDFLVYLNPEPHRRTFLKPFMRTQTAEFCSACHKVHLDVPVNHYRWTRGFNDYDNWQASGVSGLGARSFYYPRQPQNCADCHMPDAPSKDTSAALKVVHTHSFLAANTAVPFANEDKDQLDETEQFLRANKLTVDIFALTPESKAEQIKTLPQAPGLETTFAVGEEAETQIPRAPGEAAKEKLDEAEPWNVTAPLNRVSAAVRQGDVVRIDTVVRTRGVGHFFPGGTVDAFDCWLELYATDKNGQAIYWSGLAEDDGKGPVEPGAHFYRSLLIDAHQHPINKRNAWAARATVYAHLIPPGAADTVHFRIKIPDNAAGPITLHARLNYRKFSWWNTQFSFAGVPDPTQKSPAVAPEYDDSTYLFTGDVSDVSGKIKAIPAPPIVELASDDVELKILPRGVAEPKPQIDGEAKEWTRWNDYGIGLFLQGDLKGALDAFTEITKIAPQNPDGWVNVGRVRAQEGNLPAAKEVLEKALAVSPNLARAHFFLATVLRNQGEYDQAAQHLQTVLDQYPKDRVVHDDLGRIYFLQRRYNDAIRELNKSIGIDPENLEANYNLMLCYTGLGQTQRAGEYQERYLRFKADESAQTLTGPYLRSHPDDNNERQPIHEHVSVSPDLLRTAQATLNNSDKTHRGAD
jgi:tetratricopeptide (TPR) repeat protein